VNSALFCSGNSGRNFRTSRDFYSQSAKHSF
jgi:hypothetical protein